MDCNCTCNYELVYHVEPHFKHIYKFIVTETYLCRILDKGAHCKVCWDFKGRKYFHGT